MVASGSNPYDHAQWVAEHERLGATSVPDAIFLYPLPQAFLLVPLAWLPVGASFLAWTILSELAIAFACLLLLNFSAAPVAGRLLLPLALLFLFFGPVYLSLQIGAIGAIALLVLVFSILLLDRGRDLLAGLLLSLLILKPSQGLPILLLIGAWLLFRRNLRSVYGMLAGGLILLLGGLLYDPHWIPEFLVNSQLVSARTLGVQSNAYSFAYLLCGRQAPCGQVAGSVAALLILGLGAALLWRNRKAWTDWEAFNLAIPLGFLSAVYIWSYDQILYIIPLVWIAVALLRRTRSYLVALGIVLLADLISFTALGVQAYTLLDRLSLTTTVLVLGLCLWLQRPAAAPAALAPAHVH
jgi:hypothetical protein